MDFANLHAKAAGHPLRAAKIAATLLVLLATPISIHAAEAPGIEALCKQLSCRGATPLHARINAQSYYDGEWPMSPYYHDGLASVVLGETITFVASRDQEGNIILQYSEKDADNSIVVSLYQPGDKVTDVATFAKIHNNTEYHLVYKGAIFHLESGTVNRTSVCALMPGLTAMETWPYAVGMFLFRDIKVVSEKDAVEHGCR